MTTRIGNNDPQDAGQVAERLKAPVSKTGNGLVPFVGSNPTLSAS